SDLLTVDGGVDDLDLGVVLLVLFFDLAVGDLRGRDDEITNLARGDVISPIVLVFLGVNAAHPEPAQVFAPADKRALLVSERSSDQIADFAVSAGQVKLAPLIDYQAFGDQLVESLLVVAYAFSDAERQRTAAAESRKHAG